MREGNRFFKYIEEYRDEKGFIGHMEDGRLCDFGDSAQRTMQYMIVQFMYKATRETGATVLAFMVTQLRCAGVWKGRLVSHFRRHWNANMWSGQPFNMSVDNFEPILQALSLYSPYNRQVKVELICALKLIWKRAGFTWNYYTIDPKPEDAPKIPDWMRPWNLISLTIRGLRLWWAYPLLWATDGFLIIESIIRVAASYIDRSDNSPCLNHQGRLVVAQMIYWTPIVWLAKEIYSFRACAKPSDKPVIPGYGPLTVYQAYFDEIKDPPMDVVWTPVIERYLL